MTTRRILRPLLLTVAAMLGLATTLAAAELYVIRDGKLVHQALDWPEGITPERPYIPGDPFWGQWVHCAGTTRDGLFVIPLKFEGRNNHSRFSTAKSALGDCEFKVVFSCSVHLNSFPNVTITDRGQLRFSGDGSQVWLSVRKRSLPLKPFAARCAANPYDGKMHSLAIKRIKNTISFFYDDKQLNEQPIDPGVNLHLWFDGLRSATKIASIKLTAEGLSDKLTTNFKSAAPIELIYDGSNKASSEPGQASSYRIPSLAVSEQGTILAFAEARRVNGRDVGNIDAVLRRSEDRGKTWGPEIVVMDAGEHSVNNPCPIVDPKTGRIWLFMGRIDIATLTEGWNARRFVHQFVTHSDDDGKTWARPRDVSKSIRDQLKPGREIVLPGPGAGFVTRRGATAGRLIVPINYTTGSAHWVAGVVYSDDHGTTWKPGGALISASVALGEAKGVELTDGRVLFNGRTANKLRGLTVIPDGGTTDTTRITYASQLPDPSCQGSVVRYSWPEDGKPGVILYSGPGLATGRVQGTLWASYDDGKTWPWKQQYYQGPSGYSDVSVLPDGKVIVLFEKDGKSDLGFTILPPPPSTVPTPEDR